MRQQAEHTTKQPICDSSSLRIILLACHDEKNLTFIVEEFLVDRIAKDNDTGL